MELDQRKLRSTEDRLCIVGPPAGARLQSSRSLCRSLTSPHSAPLLYRLYNMSVQTGSIIASQIYRAKDKKSGYATGNRALIGIAVYNIILTLGVKCA